MECSAFYLIITQLDMSNFITMLYGMYVFSELLGWIYFVIISGLNLPECKYLLFVVLELFIPVIAADILLNDRVPGS